MHLERIANVDSSSLTGPQCRAARDVRAINKLEGEGGIAGEDDV